MQIADARALGSLVWLAGFAPELSTGAQLVLGRLSPDEILVPTARHGFPMREAEMAWVAEAIREVLLALRALIDWYLERTDRGRSGAPEVQDIPIL